MHSDIVSQPTITGPRPKHPSANPWCYAAQLDTWFAENALVLLKRAGTATLVLDFGSALAIVLAVVRAGQLAARGPSICPRRVRARVAVVVTSVLSGVESDVEIGALEVFVVVHADVCHSGGAESCEKESGGEFDHGDGLPE